MEQDKIPPISLIPQDISISKPDKDDLQITVNVIPWDNKPALLLVSLPSCFGCIGALNQMYQVQQKTPHLIYKLDCADLNGINKCREMDVITFPSLFLLRPQDEHYSAFIIPAPYNVERFLNVLHDGNVEVES